MHPVAIVSLFIIILIGLIALILLCPDCWYGRWFHRLIWREPYINFESEEEQQAFCKTMGQAVETCKAKRLESQECREFNQSAEVFKKKLNVLLALDNREKVTDPII